MPHRRGAGGGMTDADFRKLQLDYYKTNPKSGALPFEDFLKEVQNDQAIREAVRSRGPGLSKKEKSIKEAVGSKRHKVHGSAIHRASDLLGHDHHSHGSRSARPHVSPRMDAHAKHKTPSARGMEDRHGMAGRGFENEPLLPRQRGDLRGTGTDGRDGIFEDRRPSGRLGSHHGSGRHAGQAEGLHQDRMAEDFAGMRLGDQGHHGHRSGPHGFGSRTGPTDDVYNDFQYTSRGSRGGAREPPIHEELPPRRGHHGGRSVRETDLQPLGGRRATPAPLSSQHSRTQGGRHHTTHGGFSQHPGFQGSQGGRGGREDDYW